MIRNGLELCMIKKVDNNKGEGKEYYDFYDEGKLSFEGKYIKMLKNIKSTYFIK